MIVRRRQGGERPVVGRLGPGPVGGRSHCTILGGVRDSVGEQLGRDSGRVVVGDGQGSEGQAMVADLSTSNGLVSAGPRKPRGGGRTQFQLPLTFVHLRVSFD